MGTVLLIDGLAYGAMPAEVSENLGRPIVALVHHPLGLESGLSPEQQAVFSNPKRPPWRLPPA